MKWKNASRVLYDGRISIKLKGKIYKTTIQPIVIYGTVNNISRGSIKGRGRPKITLVEGIKNDMSIRLVTKSMTSDWIE